MKYILYFLLSMSFLGCSGRGLENAIDNGMVAMSGNKPPSFFKIANTQTMKDYVFNVKDATFSLPSAKEKDFTTMGGWEGSTHYNKDVVLYLDKGLGVSYHIHITSSIYPYTERERAIENGDVAYVNSLYHKYHPNKDISLQRYGKENYPCEVMPVTRDIHFNANREKSSFGCYKFNPDRTMVKAIGITLTYGNVSASGAKEFCKRRLLECQEKQYPYPNWIKNCNETKISCSAENLKNRQELANEYTYEDLQKRSQRILDSLYIKDGWER